MALTDLTRISTSGIATGSTIDSPILRKDVDFRGNQVGVTSVLFDSSERELNFKDNVKLTFGDKTNGDLQVYHNGSDNYIDATTGSLYFRNTLPTNTIFQTGNFTIKNQSNNQNVANFAPGANGGGLLYHENILRFNTTSSGAVVTGVLTATSFSGPIIGSPISNPSGISTFYDVRVINNLTVEGTTTTLDTNLIGVDRVEVGANSNSIVGVAITQSGTADLVNLFDGATKVVAIDDTGKVGIGTDAPTELIDVLKTSNMAKIKLRTTTAGAFFEADSVSSGYHGLILSSGGTQRWLMGGYASNNFTIKDGSAASGDERFTIVDGTGKVGINSTSPSERLDVVGNIKASGTITGSSFVGALPISNDGNDRVITATGTTGTLNAEENFTYNGTSCTIKGTTDGVLNLDTTDSRGSFIRFKKDGTTKVWVGSGQGLSLGDLDDLGLMATDNIIMRAGSSEKLRIDANGNIINTGIATSFVTTTFSANFAKLDLRGTNIANSNHYLLSYGAGHANNQEFHMVNTLGEIVFRTGSGSDTDRLRIDTSGRISNNSRVATDYGSPNLLISGTNSMFTMMGDGSINNSSYTGIKFRVAGGSTGDYTKAGIFVVRQGGYNDLDMLFCFNTAANATGVSDGDEKLRITSDGNALFGGTAVSQTNRQLVLGSNAEANLAIETHNTSASETANIRFYRSRGTAASPTTLVNDDVISQLLFYGHDGTDYAHAAGLIRVKCNGTVAGNQMPGEMSFHTNHGTTYATERLKIQANGRITMGEANFDASNDLHIKKANDAGDVAIRITNNTSDNASTASLYFTTSPTQDFNTSYIQAKRQGGKLNFGYATNNPTVSFKVSTNQVGINTTEMSTNEYLTLRPSGNNMLGIAYRLNNSNDVRHMYYDSGGTHRGGFGFTEYANNTDYPNYHDSFYWMTHNGTSLRTAMRMNNQGVLVRPYHPAFHWRKNAGQTYNTTWATISYDDKIFDRGTAIKGSDMVSSSSFTAPVTGIYFFHADANVVAYSGHYFYMAFFLNGNQYSRTMFAYNQERRHHEISMIIEMQQGDTVDARAKTNSSSVTGDNDGKFFGYLIG